MAYKHVAKAVLRSRCGVRNLSRLQSEMMRAETTHWAWTPTTHLQLLWGPSVRVAKPVQCLHQSCRACLSLGANKRKAASAPPFPKNDAAALHFRILAAQPLTVQRKEQGGCKARVMRHHPAVDVLAAGQRSSRQCSLRSHQLAVDFPPVCRFLQTCYLGWTQVTWSPRLSLPNQCLRHSG